MKSIISTLVSIIIAVTVMAQETTTIGSVSVTEDKDKTVVKVGNPEKISVTESRDTTRIKLGNRGVTIIEDEDGTDINWSELDDSDDMDFDSDDGDEKEYKKKSKFKPNWAGFEVGINNYVNKDFEMNLDPENAFMDLNTGRSWNFNLNILEYGLGLGTDKVGLVTGLGFEWNNYHFDNGNVIYKNEDGVIGEYLVPVDGASVRKAKLQTTYLTAPLLLEFQIPAGKKRVHISGGVIGGIKLGSKTKMVYTDAGNKQKDKVRDDFNINSLRYGFTARVGYRALKIYANYYPVALFEKGKGPELYPFSVGLTLIPF